MNIIKDNRPLVKNLRDYKAYDFRLGSAYLAMMSAFHETEESKKFYSRLVKDKKNDTANNFSLEVNQSSQGAKFQFFFKVENLKLLPGSYDVSISSKNISHFKSKTDNVEYWIALEPESTYKV